LPEIWATKNRLPWRFNVWCQPETSYQVISMITETNRFETLPLNPDGIPGELKAIPRWLLWRLEDRAMVKFFAEGAQ